MTIETNTLTEQNGKEIIASLWWMPLVRGILLIIFGIIMFSSPGSTLLSLIWFMGIYWVVDGIFSIIEGLRGHTEKSRTWTIIGGIFGILAGLFIVGNPLVAGIFSSAFLATLIGIATVASGLVMIFKGRDGQWTWWGLIMGILYVIFGIFIFAHPLATISTLVWLFALWALVSGVLAIVLAFKLRGLAKS
ncbi:MAG: DUF308 domain-containing protein [Anaerolineales bacterium]|nr:DUF308 domain-containing protein [Anaerolineales bacterium]MCA9963772.1 DUF308 domain-containing protein [Anaerolineales bacterium]